MIIALILASLIPTSGVRSYQSGIRRSGLGIRRPGIRYQNRGPSTGILRPFTLKRANTIQRISRPFLVDTSLKHLYRKPGKIVHVFADGHTLTINPSK